MKLRQYCRTHARRQEVAASNKDMGGGLELNGIDFLEVLDSDAPSEELRQRIIDLTFLKTDGVTQGGVPVLGVDNVFIDGGTRIRNIRIEKVEAGPNDRTLRLTLDRAGDFSRYTLRLQADPQTDAPPANMDPVLSCVEFTFKAECPSEFDCWPATGPAGPGEPGPVLDYLAKDYESFRQLMLDRMAATIPEWTERSPADLGVTLVEALAYAADHASYYQDAVATEAYLALARLRTSVRRHARLLAYRVHEGCNARTFVVIDAAQDAAPVNAAVIPKGTRFVTTPQRPNGSLKPALRKDQFAKLRDAGVLVFEAMEDLREIRTKRNGIAFHTWSEKGCCLPRGTTVAHLVGTQAELGLVEGDVLVLEELVPRDGTAADRPDTEHRQAVRLIADARELSDPLDDTPVLEVRWHPEDALRFPLNLSGDGANPGAVARGNAVLADHGESIMGDATEPGLFPAQPTKNQIYRPRLTQTDITYAAPYEPRDPLNGYRPADAALNADVKAALPVASLTGAGDTWKPQYDLLGSDRFAPEFVVETGSERSATLRFGDGRFGKKPGDSPFTADVRIGNGPEANIGADAISHVFTDDPDVIANVRNPLPAAGGTVPESLTTLKINAPRAFRQQRRAVTAQDYARAAENHGEVQRAVAERRWTGSWYTMFISVDRLGDRPVDSRFEASLRTHIEKLRLAGHDMEFEPPDFVPLDIALVVCVEAGHYAADVNRTLLAVFGTGQLADGTRGFFHPDNISFGTPVLLSRIIARAMEVAGVRWVGLSIEGVGDRGRFRRLHDQSVDYGDDGIIEIARREVVRLDNDPNAPENGRLRFIMEGGR